MRKGIQKQVITFKIASRHNTCRDVVVSSPVKMCNTSLEIGEVGIAVNGAVCSGCCEVADDRDEKTHERKEVSQPKKSGR